MHIRERIDGHHWLKSILLTFCHFLKLPLNMLKVAGYMMITDYCNPYSLFTSVIFFVIVVKTRLSENNFLSFMNHKVLEDILSMKFTLMVTRSLNLESSLVKYDSIIWNPYQFVSCGKGKSSQQINSQTESLLNTDAPGGNKVKIWQNLQVLYYDPTPIIGA